MADYKEEQSKILRAFLIAGIIVYKTNFLCLSLTMTMSTKKVQWKLYHNRNNYKLHIFINSL